MRIAVVAAVTVVLAIAVIAGLLVTRLDRIVIDTIEAYGEAATGTDVNVSGIELALSKGRVALSTLTVANPSGFENGPALRINRIDIDLNLSSLGADVIVVNNISVMGAELNVEQRGRDSNVGELLKHMESGESAPSPEDEGSIVIDRFTLSGGVVTLTADVLEEPQTLELDDVSLTAIGRERGGVTYTEATDVVLGAILATARTAVRRVLRDAAGQAVRQEAEEAVRERVRDLLN